MDIDGWISVCIAVVNALAAIIVAWIRYANRRPSDDDKTDKDDDDAVD